MSASHEQRRVKYASPGMYIIVGRRDDSDEIVFSIVADVPQNPKLTTLCRRALYEMGLNNPLVYEFIAMIYSNPRGGSQVVLDQSGLRRYVHIHYS